MERNTIYLIIALIFTLLFVSGIYKYQVLDDPKQPNSTEDLPTSAVNINSDEPIKCFRDDDSVIYVDGKNIYFEGINAFILTSSDAKGLLLDNVLWIWTENGKDGLKLTFSVDQNWKDDFFKGFDLSSLKCQPADIPEGIFTPPSGINFLEG